MRDRQEKQIGETEVRDRQEKHRQERQTGETDRRDRQERQTERQMGETDRRLLTTFDYFRLLSTWD